MKKTELIDYIESISKSYKENNIKLQRIKYEEERAKFNKQKTELTLNAISKYITGLFFIMIPIFVIFLFTVYNLSTFMDKISSMIQIVVFSGSVLIVFMAIKGNELIDLAQKDVNKLEKLKGDKK